MEGCLELGNVTTCCNGLQWLMGWSRHVMLLQNTECVHTTTLQNNLFFLAVLSGDKMKEIMSPTSQRGDLRFMHHVSCSLINTYQ